jgi:hypothetical protein
LQGDNENKIVIVNISGYVGLYTLRLLYGQPEGRAWCCVCSCQPTVGLIVSEKKTFFIALTAYFFNELTTAQAVDPLLLYRDFPGTAKIKSPTLYIFYLFFLKRFARWC